MQPCAITAFDERFVSDGAEQRGRQRVTGLVSVLHLACDMGRPGGVPPGFVRVRRCADSRNRPLAALAPAGQRSFPPRRAALRGAGCAGAAFVPAAKTSCPPGDGLCAGPCLAAPWPDSREAPRPPDGLA